MSNVYNTFAHVELGTGRATLAIRETVAEGKPTTLEVGVSFCSPNEQFSRRIGRVIAEGRLTAKRRFYCVAVRNKDLKLKTQAEALFHQLLGEENVVLEGTKSLGWQAPISNRRRSIGEPRVDLPRWVEQAA